VLAQVSESRLFSAAQRDHVLDNLSAMRSNLQRLGSAADEAAAANLKEAVRIRLAILGDNVKGCV